MCWSVTACSRAEWVSDWDARCLVGAELKLMCFLYFGSLWRRFALLQPNTGLLIVDNQNKRGNSCRKFNHLKLLKTASKRGLHDFIKTDVFKPPFRLYTTKFGLRLFPLRAPLCGLFGGMKPSQVSLTHRAADLVKPMFVQLRSRGLSSCLPVWNSPFRTERFHQQFVWCFKVPLLLWSETANLTGMLYLFYLFIAWHGFISTC